jgi:TonB family protein
VVSGQASWASAVLVSVLVHLALGGGVLCLVGRRPVTTVANAARPASRPAGFTRVTVLGSARATPPAPKPQASVASVRPTRRSQATQVAAQAVVIAATGLEASTEGPGEPEGTAAQAVMEYGEGSAVGAPLAAQGAGGAASGEDLGALSALVHAQLAAVAERCYPAGAKRFHQTGAVGLRFCIDAAGAVAQAEVRAPSGAAPLDGAALDCVLPAATPFPRSTSNHCFEVAVRFGLR